jgi:N6-L-threonylcarbamoyladenine synthase
MGSALGWQTFIPKMEYCTDNAAMIALTGYYKFRNQSFSPVSVTVSARAGW